MINLRPFRAGQPPEVLWDTDTDALDRAGDRESSLLVAGAPSTDEGGSCCPMDLLAMWQEQGLVFLRRLRGPYVLFIWSTAPPTLTVARCSR